MKQRPPGQPLEQGIAVFGGQQFIQSIVAADAGASQRNRQEMQVVIAESDGGGLAQRANPAQHAEGLRTAIDQIPDEPQSIAIRGEPDGAEQGAEFLIAALHVADCV